MERVTIRSRENIDYFVVENDTGTWYSTTILCATIFNGHDRVRHSIMSPICMNLNNSMDFFVPTVINSFFIVHANEKFLFVCAVVIFHIQHDPRTIEFI